MSLKAVAKSFMVEALSVRGRMIRPVSDAALRERPALVVSLGGIGNTLMATPVLSALKESVPEIDVDLLTTAPAAELLEGSPHVRRVIVDRAYRSSRRSGYFQVQREVRDSRYGSVYFVLNSILVSFVARGVLAGIPRRFMHSYDFRASENLNRLATDVLPRNPAIHDVDANVDLVRAAFSSTVETGPLILPVVPGAREEAVRHLRALNWSEDAASVAIFPGGSQWQWDKWWPRERYFDLVRALKRGRPDTQVLVHCGPAEDEETAAWKKAFGESVLIVRGLSLPVLAASIPLTSVVLCNDSLPVHLCSALQHPCVTLFGPTDPVRTGPWRTERTTVLTPDGDWAPYFKLPYPPDPHDYPRYMERISIEKVYEAVVARLDTAGVPPLHESAG